MREVDAVRVSARDQRTAARQAARQALEQARNQVIDVLGKRFDALAQAPGAKRSAHAGANDGARERILLQARLWAEAARSEWAHVGDRAQHHNCDSDALDTVKPAMTYRFGLRGKRREGGSGIQEGGEPFQPKHHPAVKPLEAKIGDRFGDKAHA